MERIIRMLKSLPGDGAVPDDSVDADGGNGGNVNGGNGGGDTSLQGRQVGVAADGASDGMPEDVDRDRMDGSFMDESCPGSDRGDAPDADVESVRGHGPYDQDPVTARLAAEAEEAAAALGPRSTTPGGSLMEVTIMEQVKNGRSVF